jgi:hypothetical protein
MVAETTVLIAAKSTNLKVSEVRSKTSKPRANRRTRYAVIRASAVLPMPIPKDVATDPKVATLTKKALRKIAGQSKDPKSRQAASAIPDGAQIAVALGWTVAK